MKVKTSGHGLNLRQSFIDNANKRLQKFDRFFNEEADAAVNVDLEKDRYTVEICGQDRFLFFEHNPDCCSAQLGRWFVEVKNREN